jgi:hypothetical protein
MWTPLRSEPVSFASHLTRAGADVYSILRQLGDARASFTLDIYAHEFEKVRKGAALGQQFAAAFDSGT